MKKTLILAFFLALSDQVSKYLIFQYLKSPQPLIGDFFKLEFSQNRGIAFGIPINNFILIPLTITLIGFMIYFAKKELSLYKTIAKISVALIFGGALGNLIDRFTYGYVIDFIAIWKWPNFNLADTYIAVGVLMVIVFYGRIKRTKENSNF